MCKKSIMLVLDTLRNFSPNILGVLKAFFRVFGCPNDALLAKAVSDLLHAEVCF